MNDRTAHSNYDRLGTSFSKRSWARNDEIAKPIQCLIDQLDSNRWLEVGSGAGDFTQLISNAGREIVSLDLSINMLRGARNQAGRVIPVQGDIHHCPFRAGVFDVVACRNVLKHCADTPSAIIEMQRVCRPSGYLLVVESCVFSELDREFMNSVIDVAEPDQKPFLTPDEWVKLLTDSGARLVSSVTFTHKVVSTREYRVEQYGLSEEQLVRHWDLFTNASSELKHEKKIRLSSDGALEFLLSWTAVVVQTKELVSD